MRTLLIIDQHPEIKALMENVTKHQDEIRELIRTKHEEHWQAVRDYLLKAGIYPEGTDFSDLDLAVNDEFGVIYEKDQPPEDFDPEAIAKWFKDRVESAVKE